jgi:predicted dehydrogenase
MKVLIAGYGSIGARHLRLFQEMYPQFEYAVLRRPESSPVTIAGAKIFTDPSEVGPFAPNLVMICNPTFLHADILEKMAPYLANGTAVFFEKPYAHTLDDLEKIASLVQTKEFQPFYGCMLRYHPLLKEMKAFLAEVKWGKLVDYKIRCLSYLPDWRPNQDYRKSYSADSNKGGGVLFDLIHEFDYAEWFFGPLNQMRGKIGKFSDLEINSDDYCLVHLQHAGAQGSVELSYAEKTPVRGFELCWEHGQVRGDLLKGTLEIHPEGKEPSRINFSIADRDVLYREQVTTLMAHLRSQGVSSEYFRQSLELNRKLIQFRQQN